MVKLSTQQLTFFGFGLLIVLFAELTFFQNGGAFLLVITGLALYFGYLRKNRFFIWTGLLFLFLACVTLVTVRLFILLLLVYLLYRYAFKQTEEIAAHKSDVQGVVYPNRLVGAMQTPLDPYQWEDMLIERFIGDISIDATQTILPTGKSVISIRQTFGKVRIVVPYEINILLHVNALYGEVTYAHSSPKRLVNESFVFRDEDEALKRTLLISVSASLADVEVVRG